MGSGQDRFYAPEVGNHARRGRDVCHSASEHSRICVPATLKADMSTRSAFLLAAGLMAAQTSLAQPTQNKPSATEKIQTIKDALVTLCLLGGSESSLSVQGNLDFETKLKDILTGNIGAAAKGATKFDKHTWEGIVGGISKDMTEIQGRQASEARKCMTDMGFPLIQEALKSQ